MLDLKLHVPESEYGLASMADMTVKVCWSLNVTTKHAQNSNKIYGHPFC